jgi:hypothetical protein
MALANTCADQPPDESLLVGSWQWQPDVSHIDIDHTLTATQTSDFDNPGASPSRYTVHPTNDNMLLLEGWMANVPCEEAGVVCDEHRAYQRHRMTYHVDEAHFFPFAMLRMSGASGAIGGAGSGVFEAFGVSESGEPPVVVETRWRLTLEPHGTWSSATRTVTSNEVDEHVDGEGSWTLDAQGNLSLHLTGSDETRRTLWKGDVIALDGLVFHRQ